MIQGKQSPPFYISPKNGGDVREHRAGGVRSEYLELRKEQYAKMAGRVIHLDDGKIVSVQKN